MLSWDFFNQVNLTQTDRKKHIGIPTAFLQELKVVTFSFSCGSADGTFNKMQNDNEREYKLMKFNREKTDLFKYISRAHDQDAPHVWKHLFILKWIPGICSLQKALYSFMSKRCHTRAWFRAAALHLQKLVKPRKALFIMKPRSVLGKYYFISWKFCYINTHCIFLHSVGYLKSSIKKIDFLKPQIRFICWTISASN